jgi:hypothetical protein
MEAGFNLHDTMIYKRNAVTHPDKLRYYSCFQYMFVFSKGNPKTINQIRDHQEQDGRKEGDDEGTAREGRQLQGVLGA